MRASSQGQPSHSSAGHRVHGDGGRQSFLAAAAATVAMLEAWPPSGSDRALVRVASSERQVARCVAASGGRWLRDLGMWEVEYAKVIELGLEGRML